MIFPDYQETKVVYHVVNINYVKDILKRGISIDKRKTNLDQKYLAFNYYLDKYKHKHIPPWVIRKRALFATMNFKKDMYWHSHSALLALKIQEEKCWIANENLANEIYDPFVLQHMEEFNQAKEYMKQLGPQRAEEYWKQSLSFQENLTYRRDREENYDAEVLIFHDIPPRDIQCLMVVTDHCKFTPLKWQEHYRKLVHHGNNL